MDYGHKAAAVAAMHVFDVSSRGTGRTTRMIQQLQEGDMVVLSTAHEAESLRRDLKRAGRDGVKVAVMDPAGPFSDQLPFLNGRPLRIIFDHVWVYKYLLSSLEMAETRLFEFQKYCSAVHVSEWANLNPHNAASPEASSLRKDVAYNGRDHPRFK